MPEPPSENGRTEGGNGMSRGGRLFREFDPAAAGYLVGWKTIGKLPEPLVRGLFNLGADLASVRGRGMDQLRRNLCRIVGPENVTRDLVRASVRSYARYWRETFWLPQIADDPSLTQQLTFSVEGEQFLQESLASGRGVVLTLPHSGNWDLAGLYVAQRYGRFTTVVERLKPEALHEAFVNYRETLGFRVLPLTGGYPTFRQLKETVEDGGIVCLMGDRDLKQTGVACEMFGEATSLPTGSVQLALKTGAALHVAHCWYPRDGGWGFSVSEEVEVTDLGSTIQRVADLFGANLAAHPEDWHMLQPTWTMDVEASRERRSREAGRKIRT